MNRGVAAKVRLAQMASTEEEEDETDDYSEEEFASTILGQDHPTVNCVERRLGSLGEFIESNPGRLPQLSREQPMRQATGGAAQFILVSNLKQVFHHAHMTEHLVREGGRICIGRELTLFEKKTQFMYL